MKTINELNKKELAQLTEQQVEAYIDIELATQSIIKPIVTDINFPNYVTQNESLPERDVCVYQVDGYSFVSMEDANKLASFISTIQQVKTDYDYLNGTSVHYLKETQYITPPVQITRMYSNAKYQASKEKIKQILGKEKEEAKTNSEDIESVINYDAIDRVKYEIRGKVRDAITFFAQVDRVAEDYDKYMSIVNDSNKAYETLFTVYNIQNQEMKDCITEKVEELLKNK